MIIKKRDPFKKIKNRIEFPLKKIYITKSKYIEIKGYIYQREKDFDDTEEYESLAGTKGWFESQGIYVYRENRIIDHQGWGDLTFGGSNTWAKEEKYKRCRVQIKYDTNTHTIQHKTKQDSTVQMHTEIKY